MSAGPAQRIEKSFCRICQAFCGMTVTIADDRIIQVRGDRDDPVSRGYACFKGLQAVEQHYGEGRLLRSLQRIDGELVPGDSGEILGAAGARLADLVAAHGSESAGFFIGTQALFNTLAPPMQCAGAPSRMGTGPEDAQAWARPDQGHHDVRRDSQ